MHQKGFLSLFTCLCLSCVLSAQKTGTNPPPRPSGPVQQPQYSAPPNVLQELREGWNLALGMDIGASQLYHKIDLERTHMKDLYDYIVKLPSTSDLTWEQFVADNEFKKSILQPRFGFSALLTYGNIPAFARGEFISSSSSYQKMSYAVTVGVGKDILFGFEEDTYFSFKGGYKIVVHDGGFGLETLLNSIGNKAAKEELKIFYTDKEDLGAPRGDLITMRIGMGKYLGKNKKTTLGLDLYSEFDLTSDTQRIGRRNQRIARMNTLGINCYINFVIF